MIDIMGFTGSGQSFRVDMHMHTTASDGTWKPERLFRELRDKGIDIFAITDHNSTENVEKSAALAKEAGMRLIPAVEVDTTYDGNNYHVLGYGIDIHNRNLKKVLEKNRGLMEEKDDESIIYLEKSGHKVSLGEYRQYVNNPERGGWKALNYLVDRGLCTSHKDFFALFAEWGNPFNKMEFARVTEVISAIRDAGGAAVLAHPGASFYPEDYRKVVVSMIDQGVMGIECFHPENSPQVTGFCTDVCRSRGLIITGGSDCHGDFVKTRSIGKPEIFIEQLSLAGLIPGAGK
jgi:predicted metal-dependent phosphoesterase TrpH